MLILLLWGIEVRFLLYASRRWGIAGVVHMLPAWLKRGNVQRSLVIRCCARVKLQRGSWRLRLLLVCSTTTGAELSLAINLWRYDGPGD